MGLGQLFLYARSAHGGTTRCTFLFPPPCAKRMEGGGSARPLRALTEGALCSSEGDEDCERAPAGGRKRLHATRVLARKVERAALDGDSDRSVVDEHTGTGIVAASKPVRSWNLDNVADGIPGICSRTL